MAEGGVEEGQLMIEQVQSWEMEGKSGSNSACKTQQSGGTKTPSWPTPRGQAEGREHTRLRTVTKAPEVVCVRA